MTLKKFKSLQYQYWLRKRGCFDLIEVFSEYDPKGEDAITTKAGLDPDDFDDKSVQDCIGVHNEERQGLYGSEYDSEGEDNDV